MSKASFDRELTLAVYFENGCDAEKTAVALGIEGKDPVGTLCQRINTTIKKELTAGGQGDFADKIPKARKVGVGRVVKDNSAVMASLAAMVAKFAESQATANV